MYFEIDCFLRHSSRKKRLTPSPALLPVPCIQTSDAECISVSRYFAIRENQTYFDDETAHFCRTQSGLINSSADSMRYEFTFDDDASGRFRDGCCAFFSHQQKRTPSGVLFWCSDGKSGLLHCARKNQRTNVNLLFHHAVFKEEGLIGFKALHIGFGEDVVEARPVVELLGISHADSLLLGAHG